MFFVLNGMKDAIMVIGILLVESLIKEELLLIYIYITKLLVECWRVVGLNLGARNDLFRT